MHEISLDQINDADAMVALAGRLLVPSIGVTVCTYCPSEAFTGYTHSLVA